MLPSSSPQSTPQHKVQDFGSVLEGENRKIWFKSQSALCCVYKVWRKMFVSPCRIPQSFLVRAWSPSKNQKVQKKKKKNITKQNKTRPQKGEKPWIQYARVAKAHNQNDEYMTCFSLWFAFRPVCFRHEKVLEHARQNCMCVCVESSFVYVNSFKIHMVPP